VGEDHLDTGKVSPALPVPGAVLYHANPASAPEVWLSARWSGRGRAGWATRAGFARLLWTHSVPRSLAAGVWGALRGGGPFFLGFKLWFDLAVFVGLCQGRWKGIKAR